MLFEWLKDLIAIAEAGSFAGASQTRHVTQPAISRRIHALEAWVGTPLLVRSAGGATLSAAGEGFLPVARELIGRLEQARDAACATALRQAGLVRFCATNALAFSFFPQWISRFEAQVPGLQVHFTTHHLEACEGMLARSEVDFLLAHRPLGVGGPFAASDYLHAVLARDVLMPVCAPAEERGRTPLHALPGTRARPAAYLAYTAQAGLGRVVDSIDHLLRARAHLRPVFATHASSVVAAMAVQRQGLGWLPQSLVQAQLDSGALVRAGDAAWDVPMDICLQRRAAPLAPGAEALWAAVCASAS